jgi:hypothetical protein
MAAVQLLSAGLRCTGAPCCSCNGNATARGMFDSVLRNIPRYVVVCTYEQHIDVIRMNYYAACTDGVLDCGIQATL